MSSFFTMFSRTASMNSGVRLFLPMESTGSMVMAAPFSWERILLSLIYFFILFSCMQTSHLCTSGTITWTLRSLVHIAGETIISVPA